LAVKAAAAAVLQHSQHPQHHAPARSLSQWLFFAKGAGGLVLLPAAASNSPRVCGINTAAVYAVAAFSVELAATALGAVAAQQTAVERGVLRGLEAFQKIW
jgi:hypothetical protein